MLKKQWHLNRSPRSKNQVHKSVSDFFVAEIRHKPMTHGGKQRAKHGCCRKGNRRRRCRWQKKTTSVRAEMQSDASVCAAARHHFKPNGSSPT